MKIKKVQKYLQEEGVDGWLLYVFGRSNDLAIDFLEIPKNAHLTRRLFYWIPQKGQPIKIVHQVEPNFLDHFPGTKVQYFSSEELTQALKKNIYGKIAMEYSPNNSIPYVSKVDGGTIELIRSFGVNVVSSAGFLQNFTCLLTDAQWKSHLYATDVLENCVSKAWQFIKEKVNAGKTVTEYDIQQLILKQIEQSGCTADSVPICAVNENSANPHYAPTKEKHRKIKKGDFILIDLWCKQKTEGSVYADITRVAVVSCEPTAKQKAVFAIVRAAQKAALELIEKKYQEGLEVTGYEADRASRKVVEDAGYRKYFIHRTGHNIYTELHGPGAQLDSIETCDDRPLIRKTLFSVEPGIYLPDEFGIRLENDVYIHPEGKIEITSPLQQEIKRLV
ncbi:MAG: M24 family metallopeptidase [Simkaniaceae bacterium]|nr:M24 family metallopeptidase [Simkaniaceae bacterium]